MGHDGFYNFLVVTMGNVVSALLMYALQAAWLCQRLIDQDYRQNHGSRLTPILDNKDLAKPIEIVTTSPDFVSLSKSAHSKIRSSKARKPDNEMMVNPWQIFGGSTGQNRRRKFGRRRRTEEEANGEEAVVAKEKLHLSHSYLENAKDSLTLEYMNGLDQTLGLRRAFSDINVSTSWLKFKQDFCHQNETCLGKSDADDRTIAVTDPDFVSLVFTNGCVT